MNSTDIFFFIAEIFQMTFLIFEFIGNFVNDFFILLIFGGLCYWMTVQRKLNKLSNVPAEIKDNEGWYKEDGKKLK
jgi:predicted membrane protein